MDNSNVTQMDFCTVGHFREHMRAGEHVDSPIWLSFDDADNLAGVSEIKLSVSQALKLASVLLQHACEAG